MSRPHYSEGHVWVKVKGAFIPDVIEARSGERLRLVFRREETAPCSERVLIASLGKSVMLPPFEDVAVDLGPLPAGEHEFGCELDVLHGRILVREAGMGAGEKPRAKGWFARMARRSRYSYAVSERRFGQMKRPTINITPAERVGRTLVGLVGAIGGAILLASAPSALAAVLEVLLVLAGLDLLVTGALGHCPLYRKLGYTPASLKGGRHEHPRPS
ncbi:MAG: cupredoxin domain-containing protein [Solirubrobacterales bacterium]